MSLDIKELRVGAEDNSKRIMYYAKEFLLNSDVINVVAGTAGAPNAARSAENLVRLGYVTYEDIHTETIIATGRRRTRLVIRLRKTNGFAKLYQENEETRKQKAAEREEQSKLITPAK